MPIRDNYAPIKMETWNEIKRKYPDAWKIFSDWIDEFKIYINWQSLFRDHLNVDAEFESPKFHHLPEPLQLGIWIQFIRDQGGCSWEIDDMFEFDLEEELFHWFTSKQLEYDKGTSNLG